MLKTRKLKAIAAAVGTAATLCSMPASAFVYSLSHLQIQDLVLAIGGAGTTVNGFTFDVTNTATLNGLTTATSNSCSGAGAVTTCGAAPVLDSGAANAPGSTLSRTNNVFTFLGANGTDSYSGADSVIKTAELVGGVPTNTEQIAESLLNINGQARANAEILSNTSLSLTAVVGAGGTLSLSFEADPDQRVAISEALAGLYLSQSNMNASFSLTNDDLGQSLTFSPNGIVGLCSGSIAGATCTELFDDVSLNANLSTGLNPSDLARSLDGPVFGNFGLSISGLVAGNYTVAFNAVTSTSITRVVAVPEPGSVGLVGLALAGLAFTANRARRRESKV